MMVCELIDILKQYDPEQEVGCFDEWGAEQELTERVECPKQTSFLYFLTQSALAWRKSNG